MKKAISILLFLLISPVLMAQDSKTENRNSHPNNALKSGQLENGFRYFIKPLEGDKGKIQVKLIVNAGSFQEDEDQYNLAHLLEHMAFNTTEHFPALRNDPDFFSQLKMKPQDLRALVGGNKTLYSFEYSQEVSKALDTALSIYYDIASGKVKFEEEAVEGERKAIYQERIDGSDPGALYPEFKIHYYLSGCNDAPDPDKLQATIMHSSTKALKRFYRDWYRPDLMTLIVVGNIKNVDQVEEKIRKKFKDLTLPEKPRQKKHCNQNYLNGPEKFIIQEKTAIITEEMVPQTTFQFYYRRPNIYFENFSKKNNNLIWDLLSTMLSNRLKSEQLDYNVNYETTMYPSEELPAVKLSITTSDRGENAVKKVFNILAGISAYGFKNEEWESVVNKRVNYLRGRDYSSADIWSDALEKIAVEGEGFPESNDNREVVFLQNLDVQQVNELINEQSWKPNDIAVILPKRPNKTIFTRPIIQNWIDEGLNHPKRYEPIIAPEQLIASSEVLKLGTSKIIDRRFGNFNEDIITLENGMRIILKDLNPESGRYKDKIMVHGFSPYGAACFGPKDMETLLAPNIIQNSGAGNYNKFEVQKLLSTTSIPFGITDYIEQQETGIKAEVSPDDMEIVLQLVYLSFTEPRFNKKAFEDWKMQEEKRSRRNTNANNDFIDFINHENGKVKIPQGGERYRQSLHVDYKEAYKKYKALHANAKDYTFILTGDFKKNDVLPLLQKYLGNLPNTGRPHRCQKSVDKNSSYANMIGKSKNFHIPYAVDNNLLSIQFRTDLKGNEFKEEVKVEFLKQALDLKLKGLRYEKNLGIYFSAGEASVDHETNTKTFQIFLDSNKEDFDKVLQVCNIYVEDLKTKPVSANFMQTVKRSSYLPKWQDYYKDTNKSFQMKLYDHYRYNFPWADIEKVQQYLKEFNAYDLQKTAKEYLDNENKWIMTGSSNKVHLQLKKPRNFPGLHK